MDAKTNDALRQTIPLVTEPNLFLMTRGITSLDFNEVMEILEKVKNFKDFNEGNDPWKEHDFGSFEHNGKKIFWKIDDYAGHEGYNLVLTVMLAEEY